MRSDRRSGHAVLEFALVSPWIFTLFVGALNLGILYTSISAVENAARAAAMYASSSQGTMEDEAGACTAAAREMRSLPNLRSYTGACTEAPLVLSLTQPAGPAGEPSARVSLTYRTMRLISMPPVPGHMDITREAEMRVRTQ
jgi:hypothetical protein